MLKLRHSLKYLHLMKLTYLLTMIKGVHYHSKVISLFHAVFRPHILMCTRESIRKGSCMISAHTVCLARPDSEIPTGGSPQVSFGRLMGIPLM